MTAPYSKLVERVGKAIADSLGAHESGLLDRAAQAALDACHVEEMRETLRECANDLAAEVESQYVMSGSVHPANAGRYARDMTPVMNARALLAKLDATESSPSSDASPDTLLHQMELLAAELGCAIVFRQGMFHFIPNGDHPSDEMLALSVELAKEIISKSRNKA